MGKKFYAMMAVLAFAAGGMDVNAVYTLDGIEVSADRQKDRFGNMITEQSYYRTGGDVQVIDSDTIEKRHYTQVGDALKYIPGVQVQTPGGYRGGEYGYTQTHSIVSINGDARVIILVDGRRMDNSVGNPVSDYAAGSKSIIDVNQIVGMDNIEKIEVIKGPGASIYGADATGGVINIITKKGALKPVGTIDFSAGSWKRFSYGLTYSGSNDTGKLRYFFAARRELSGDSHYHDGITGKNYTWHQTGYRDNTLNARVDYKFNDRHELAFSYNHMQGNDDYPLTAPDYRYLSDAEWNRIKKDYFQNDKYGNFDNPGYRNLWITWLGAYNIYKKNNYDLTYYFGKDHGMDSFIRFYDQHETYFGSFGAGDREDAPTPFTPAWDAWAKKNHKGRDKKSYFTQLKNRGLQIQYGKAVGKHDLLTTWTYDKSRYYDTHVRKKTTSSVERESVLGYVQDKIHITDKWEITPALRYSYYSDFAKVSKAGVHANAGKSVSVVTPSVVTQFAFDDTASIYAGWTKVYRPIRVGDYHLTNTDYSSGNKVDAKLEDEKGDVVTLGVRKDFGSKTSAAVHYDWTDMKNAIARYSVWDKNIRDFKMKYVNATEKKSSINVTMKHKFNDHWSFSFNYSHAKDKWNAKNGMIFDPDLAGLKGNVNSAINKLRPQNTYTGVLTYESDKWDASLLCNYYTGLNREAYTDNRFLVFDLSGNYKVNEALSVFGTITNLTNESWENTYTAYLGMGAWPQPGRAFMLGAKYKF